jgi:hypothetical protein
MSYRINCRVLVSQFRENEFVNLKKWIKHIHVHIIKEMGTNKIFYDSARKSDLLIQVTAK